MKINRIQKVEMIDLLIVINSEDENTGFLGVNEYMGIGYLKAYLDDKGISTNIKILRTQNIDQPDQIFSVHPHFVGLCMYSDNVQQVTATTMKLRALYPEAWIVVGGPQVNRFEEQILKDNACIDMVLSYEAEETYLEVVNRINSGRSLQGCNGVTYRNGDIIVRNPFRSPIVDLNSLPFPSRYIHEQYSQQYLYLTGSRGCLGGCSFCGETSAKKDLKKPFVRLRNPKSVVDEMEELVKKYRMHAFRFTDATFEDPNNGEGMQRAEAIYDEIISRDLHVSLHLFTRAEIVNEAQKTYYEKAKKAGVECFYIGIESGNNEDLLIYNKRTSVEKNRSAINVIRNAGLHAGIGFINFNPYSTFSSVKQNVDFLHENGYGHVFYLSQTRLELLPQSHLIKRMQKDGLLADGFSYNSHFFDYRFQDERLLRLYQIFRKAYTAPPIYYMDTLSGMNRVWVQNNLHNEKLGKIMKRFLQLEDICKKYDARNYNFAVNAIEMCANDATQKQLDKLIEQTDLNGIYDEYLALYNLINIRVIKERLSKII